MQFSAFCIEWGQHGKSQSKNDELCIVFRNRILSGIQVGNPIIKLVNCFAVFRIGYRVGPTWEIPHKKHDLFIIVQN